MDKLMTLIFDIVVAVIITLVSVLIYFGLRSEAVISTMDAEITENFLSETKEKGSITTSDYENYIYQLSLTGVIYEVLIEHRFRNLEPEYRMRSLEEIIAAQKAAYTGENIYHYKEIVTQKPIVTDPINNSGLTMNTETNESILAGAVNTPSTGHVHTDTCYLGHKHNGVKSFTHSHAHNGLCTQYVQEIYFHVTCRSCGKQYDWGIVTNYWNPITKSVVTGNVWGDVGLKNCISCNSTNVTYGSSLSEPGYSCGYEIDENGDRWNDIIPNGLYKNYSGKSVPQSILKSDYISGCFTYHNARYFPRDSSNYLDVSQKWEITADYMTKFCELPKEYRIRMDVSYNGSTSTYYFPYTASLQPNGQVILTKGYCFDYPQFAPATIPLSTMIALGWNMRELAKYNGTNVNNYIISDASIYSSYDYYGATISICDHTAEPANKWVEICGQIENATLACNQRVVSITPTNPVQSVYTNETLITTVKATYQDGSKRVVLGTTSFTTGTPIVNKTITLSYTDTLGITNTCNAIVNVIPKTKICVNGHLYNLNNDGSDPGCIFCNSYVRALKIIQPNTSTWTITIGTSLSDNGLKLLVTYLDGHTETLTAGYEDNLDKQYLGTKMVTIGYKGATTQILVTTVCARLTCDICGFTYDIYPDGTNPGCPRCISKTPVFTGNVLNYDSVNYTEDILEDLYQDGIYRFNKNDTLSITIDNKSSSISGKLLRKIFPNMTKTWLHLEESETIQSK